MDREQGMEVTVWGRMGRENGIEAHGRKPTVRVGGIDVRGWRRIGRGRWIKRVESREAKEASVNRWRRRNGGQYVKTHPVRVTLGLNEATSRALGAARTARRMAQMKGERQNG